MNGYCEGNGHTPCLPFAAAAICTTRGTAAMTAFPATLDRRRASCPNSMTLS